MARALKNLGYTPQHDAPTNEHDWGQRTYAAVMLDSGHCRIALCVKIPDDMAAYCSDNDHMHVHGDGAMMYWLRMPVP